MRHGKNSFRHESLQDARSIRNILKSITTGLGSGKLTFSDEDDEMTMQPEGLLQFELVATQEENRNKLNLCFSWQGEDDVPKKKKNLSVETK